MATQNRLVQVLVLTLGLAFLILSWGAGGPQRELGFPLDDAWIHMVYGRQWAHDGYLAYNPGVPATGATSPLWALCLAALHLMLRSASVDTLVLGTYVVNGTLHLLTIWGAMQLSLASGGTRAGAVATGVCLATTPLLALSTFSGMEVTLCAALLVLGHERLLRGQPGLAGLLMGLACWARPEAALCLGGASVLLVTVIQKFPCSASRRPWSTSLLRLAVAPVVLGSTLVSYNLWASGKPLPATFYFKQAVSLTALPERFWTAATEILSRLSPFAGGFLWIGLLGLLAHKLLRQQRKVAGEASTGIVAGTALVGDLLFLLGNVVTIAPIDPPAYYHQRYVLPAAPLLVVALVSGLDALRVGTRPWTRHLPVVAITLLSSWTGFRSIGETSRHFHSDIRNINELQRTLGEWLGAHTDETAWVGSVDAGAIRYFSRRPVVDIMGLNTPELYWDSPAYAESHPVQAIALMPWWFSSVQGLGVGILHEVRSQPYTVTSYPAMGRQVVVGCARESAGGPRHVQLVGIRRVTLSCSPR